MKYDLYKNRNKLNLVVRLPSSTISIKKDETPMIYCPKALLTLKEFKTRIFASAEFIFDNGYTTFHNVRYVKPFTKRSHIGIKKLFWFIEENLEPPLARYEDLEYIIAERLPANLIITLNPQCDPQLILE